uniref:Uncharacterized protein n=1 Tax=Oryza glaberrima TaxID=4538 RepID=I1R6E5_ORYGL
MAACFRCAQSAAAVSGPAGPNRLPPAGRRCPSPWCTTPWPPRGSAAVAGRSKLSSGLPEAPLEREHCGAVVDDGGVVGTSSGTVHGEDLLLRRASGHLADEQPHPLAVIILRISGRGRTAMMVCHDVEMPFLRGINVNRPAPATETTTARGATVARRKRSPARPPPTARSPAGSDDENCGGGGGSRVPWPGQGRKQQQ